MKHLWLCLLLCWSAGAAVMIPAERLTDWTPGVRVGVIGGIPTNRTHIIDASLPPYNANKTGSADTSAAMQAAIDAGVAGDIVYFPAGRYRFDVGLGRFKSGCTYLGDGTNTIFDSHCSGLASFYLGTTADSLWNAPSTGNSITAGLAVGSTNVTIASTAAFRVNHLAQIDADDLTDQYTLNDIVMSTQGGSRNQRQKVMIKAKTATTLTFWPPLLTDFTGRNPKIWSATLQPQQFHDIGFENFFLELTNAPATFGIYGGQLYNCWFKDVQVFHCQAYSVPIYDSLNIEIRRSRIGRILHQGNNGGGLLFFGVSSSLVEDNILEKSFPLYEGNGGDCGNVLAYNLGDDGSSFGTEGFGLAISHSSHTHLNLYEGNVMPNLEADGLFGSDSRTTAFRNWFTGFYPGHINGWSWILKRFTRMASFVGNISGTNGSFGAATSYGEPNIGNGSFSGYAPPWAEWGTKPGSGNTFQELDTNVIRSTILIGNYYHHSNAIPAAEAIGSMVLSNSLYQASKPPWFGTLPWPPFDPRDPNAIAYDRIPAGYRFIHNAEVPQPTVDVADLSNPPLAPFAVRRRGR